mgnify:CR=1 FL=1
MDLKPGDIQLLNNRCILHSREDYEDYPEPDRRRMLLRYFGEVTDEPCGNCDACLEPVETVDGTAEARLVLDAVQGNKSHASRVLGVDRRTLYRKLEE